MFIILEFTFHCSLNLVVEQNLEIYGLSLAVSQSTLRESTHDQFQDLKRTFEYVFTKLGFFCKTF